MGSFVSPAPFAAELRRHLLRTHPFFAAPTPVRNTFTAGFSVQAGVTGLTFLSGGTSESNKLYEVAVESTDDLGFITFRAPGATNGCSDFVTLLRCMIGQAPSDRTKFDSTAFVGVEKYSQGTALMSGVPGNDFARVEWRVDDPSEWRLVLGKAGDTKFTTAFSVPHLGSASDDAPGGHMVELLCDPFRHHVVALVDGVPRASDTDPAHYPLGTFAVGQLASGLVAYSGVMSGAATLQASWGGVTLIDYGTNAEGSGVV